MFFRISFIMSKLKYFFISMYFNSLHIIEIE